MWYISRVGVDLLNTQLISWFSIAGHQVKKNTTQQDNQIIRELGSYDKKL